jgi:hypothetical protein
VSFLTNYGYSYRNQPSDGAKDSGVCPAVVTLTAVVGPNVKGARQLHVLDEEELRVSHFEVYR